MLTALLPCHAKRSSAACSDAWPFNELSLRTFAGTTRCERFRHSATRGVDALTFPICNRFDLNRRARSARPIAEAAVAAMEIEDETLESDRHAAAWRHADRACRQRRL